MEERPVTAAEPVNLPAGWVTKPVWSDAMR
ncbi:hypothetical protein ABIA31_001471 [Catenulispora sp. MAP5-51]